MNEVLIEEVKQLKCDLLRIENDNKILKKEFRLLKETFDKLKGKNIIF